jgi:hypothetical protein
MAVTARPAKQHHSVAPSSTGLAVAELKRWLAGPGEASPSLNDLASVFGLSFDPGSYVRAEPEQLRFTFALLRDAFADDGAARCWLRTASPVDGHRPIDHLLGGRIGPLEELAAHQWNSRREP